MFVHSRVEAGHNARRMLSAACPSCGAPAPVSLATPEWIACGSCRYQGPPDPEISRQLRVAAAALWQMDASDRQLTGAQRLNVRSARSYLLFLCIGLGAVLLPLLLMAGGCVALFATGDSLEPAGLLIAVSGALPFVLGVGASALALRHVYRRGVALEARCVAAPPVAEGHPARCHVCGGPLEVRARTGIARCGFCQADNVVSEAAWSRIGARRQAQVGQLVERVQGEARALDRSALSAGVAAFAIVLLSPLLGFVLFVAVALVGTAIETAPLPDGVYALVPVANTRCVAQVVRASTGEVLEHGFDSPHGTPKRSSAPAGLVRMRGAELVGRDLGLQESRRGKVKRLYRTALAPSFDRAELEVGGQSESAPLVGLCEVSTRRRTVGYDERLESATRMRADGDRLLISAGNIVLGVPKAGGTPSVSLQAEGPIIDFRRRGASLIVLRMNALERREGDQTERLVQDLTCFALDGEEILIGKEDGLFRRDGSGNVTQIDATLRVSAIAVESDAIYWVASGGELRELTKASRQVRRVGTTMQALDLVRVGQYLYVSDKVLGPSFVPLGGGSQVDLDGNSWAGTQVRTDGKAAYFPIATSGRGGVGSVVPGRSDMTGALHYGIDTHEAKAFTVDGGEVYWVDGKNVVSEPVLPP